MGELSMNRPKTKMKKEYIFFSYYLSTLELFKYISSIQKPFSQLDAINCENGIISLADVMLSK